MIYGMVKPDYVDIYMYMRLLNVLTFTRATALTINVQNLNDVSVILTKVLKHLLLFFSSSLAWKQRRYLTKQFTKLNIKLHCSKTLTLTFLFRVPM